MESKTELLDFNFDNSFSRNLEDFFVSCSSEPSSSPQLLQFNRKLAKELGLNPALLDSEKGLDILELEKEILEITGIKAKINFDNIKEKGNIKLECNNLSEFNFLLKKI